jgi:hypothetical protein
MPDSLFTAKEFDEAKDNRRRRTVIIIISALVILAGLAFFFRYWPYEHRVDTFFAALEHKEYKQAFAIWVNDPNWEQQPEKYVTQGRWNYPYSKFYEDWGPAGEWGVIESHHVDKAGTLAGQSTGVIVVVTINKNAKPIYLWVEKKSKTISCAPMADSC